MKKLHIVSFNNPYPPDYGGVIDVYYKIKALHEAGIAVILHVFEYNRPSSPELNELCEKVYYYPRKTGWASQFSFTPYIIKSRQSGILLENILLDEYPVLFEGLHTCFYLDHPGLENRLKLVRMHNIEHEYYSYLAKTTHNLKNKIYFRTEGTRLKAFESILLKADHILAISTSDNEYFEGKYGKSNFIPAFHPNTEISSLEGKGRYILMHGNLSVEENEFAILHCIRNIFQSVDFPVIIAGKDPTERLKAEISANQKIILIENPSEAEMSRLQHEAHIHLCYTFQPSGLKLKLLNSLYRGRFVVANPLMTEGSGLRALTHTGTNDGEIIDIINSLVKESFTAGAIDKRRHMLETYSNKENASKIINLLDSWFA